MEENENALFTPREYQTAIMEKAMKENIIIYLPTGAGKTYIATLLIKRMCGAIKKTFSEGGKRTFFLVNTVQLVEQQAQAIRQCIPLHVGEFSGDKGVDNWTEEDWRRQFDQHEILVMTAQIFHDILNYNFIKLENVNLLIFDECHRAVQAHPMRQIMAQFEQCPVEKQPRVLGLTATLLNGSCKPENVDEEITHLERTLHSKIVSFIDDEQVLRFSTNPVEQIIYYDSFEMSDLSTYCNTRLTNLAEKISHIQFEMLMANVEAPQNYSILNNREEKPRKSLKNILSDLQHCLEDMSVFGLYVGALAQIVRLERMKLNCVDGFLYNILNVCVTELIFIRKIISDQIDESSYSKITQYLSPKVLFVLDLLKEFDDNSTLIFVERRFTAKVLCSLIKDFVMEASPDMFKNVKIDFVIGSTSSNLLATNEVIFARKVNSEVVEKFYKKKLNVLIATDVLEEGTDIPLCNTVVKYDTPLTFRSYIQSKGRARSKESKYFLMVPKSDGIKFAVRHQVFKATEKRLKDILLRDRQKPSEEEIDEDLYQDKELPPFCPLGPDGPKVTMIGAPSLINRYVQSLPQDKFSTMIPLYFVKHDLESDKYNVQLQLPSNCPIKKLIQGPEMDCSKSAKQAAALEGCKMLYEVGELNENLLPRGSKSIYLEDPKWFPHWEDELIQKGVPEPGTSKLVRMTEKKYSITFEDCQPDVNSPVFMHVFEIKPKFELLETENKQRRMYYFSLLKKNNTFAILTNKAIPQICDFPLYISLGEMEVKMRMNIPLEALTKKQLQKLHKFHCLLFMQVLDVVKSFMVSNFTEKENANCSYMVCPVYLASESDPFSYVVDWKTIESYQERFLELHEVSDKVRKDMKFNYEALEGSLIIPWYRGYNISKQSYIVTRIARELTPLSQFPSSEFLSYSEYFKEKYAKTIYHPDQCLVDVYPVNSKLNCIVPRLRTSKRKIDTDREHMDETLVPELCVEIKFPAAYWVKAIFLPSALHRLNRLMIAEELRLKLVNDVKLGAEFYPLDKIAPLTADKINVANLPSFEAPVSPVSTVCNSFERSVMEWKTAKQSYEFPWLDHEQPADIDRSLKKVSIIDVKNFDSFVTRSSSKHKINQELVVGMGYSPKVSPNRFYNWKPKLLDPPPLTVLENTNCKLGPQQCEIFQCITALSAHDIQNYEYLETLGDSFLKFAVSLSLFLYCKNTDEGKLTRLKGKLLGNRNLFYCAKTLELASLLEVYNFTPSDDWIPPRFGVQSDLRDIMRELNLPPEELFHITFTEEEQISGLLTPESEDAMQDKLVMLSTTAENDQEPRGRSSTSITYLNRQEVADKCAADCVEALLGVFVKKCGIEEAFKLLLYLGILPDSIIRHDFVFDELFVPPVCMNEGADSPEQVQFLLEESCYEILEKTIGYTFRDKRYILEALSHTSFTQNIITECYQRLEFLGDAILDFLITCYIFETGKHLSPGQVTDVRSACVNNVTFACLAVRYGMHKSLLCRSINLRNEINKFAALQESKSHRIGEEVLILLSEKDCKLAESVDVPKALGDVFESIAGAIYLDSGKNLKTVWKVYYNLMHNELHEFCTKPPKNIVRKLYELNIDARFLPAEPVIDCPDVVMVPLEVRINSAMETVFGFGRNKSAAKKSAAKLVTSILTGADN